MKILVKTGQQAHHIDDVSIHINHVFLVRHPPISCLCKYIFCTFKVLQDYFSWHRQAGLRQWGGWIPHCQDRPEKVDWQIFAPSGAVYLHYL